MIEPLRDWIVLIEPETPETTEGGIFLTDDVAKRMKTHEGPVTAIGPEVSGKIGIGDVVLFSKWEGHVLDAEDGKTYRLIREADLFAVKRDL